MKNCFFVFLEGKVVHGMMEEMLKPKCMWSRDYPGGDLVHRIGFEYLCMFVYLCIFIIT